ncbi:MAG TPA: hypothetical protein VNA28_05385 [Solirubrobacteraceae bacterium]|nr:hypothetical protein [Solirubrobacteraceae bacterium]
MRSRLHLLAAALTALLIGAAPAHARSYGFLATPTDQLAVPGHIAGFEITPEGFLYAGHGELVFRAGPRLVGLRAPVRTLDGGRYPVMRYGQRFGGVRYELDVFATPVGGQPVAFVRVTMHNTSAHRLRARWAIGMRYSGGALKANGVRRFRFPRPVAPLLPGLFMQPGAAFDLGWGYGFGDGTIVRDGSVLATFPPAPAAATVELQRREGAGPVRAATTFGLVEYGIPLGPGARRTLDFRMPVAPVPVGSPVVAELRAASHLVSRTALLRAWRATFARAMSLQLPERRVQEAYYASLMHILLPRYRLADGRWVQPVNKLRYHGFWLRDGAVMTQALDLAGLHAEARENLGFFAEWQRPSGQFISRVGQLDGHGQALWAIGEHVLRTGDSSFARAMLPRLDAAFEWLREARRNDPLGLVPESDPRDNELVAGHLAGDDFWAVAGLAAVVDAARMLGETERAAGWSTELETLRVAVRRRVGEAAARNSGAIPAVLDRPGGRDWGNLWAAWPEPVFDPASAIVTATLARARRNFREGLATYGEFHNLHHYLGFRVWQTELLRDEQARVVQGMYDALAHTTNTHGGFETGVRPYARRSVDDNLAPHGWFAAELVALLRNMLVRERDGGLELLSAVPGRWLVPGRPTVVRDAPTKRGRVDVSLHPVRGGAVLRWNAAVAEGTPLWWRVPARARGVRVAGFPVGAGAVRLPGRAGELRITWRPPARTSSFDGVTAALQKAYRARGAKPPV